MTDDDPARLSFGCLLILLAALVLLLLAMRLGAV